MEPTHATSHDDDQTGTLEGESDIKVDVVDAPKKVFAFAAPYKNWPTAVSGERTTPPTAPQRDWSAALDLVNEAYEAIRMAEERAAAAEEYSKQLSQYHSEQIRMMEARLMAADKRGEAAEMRAREAEEWLVKFHDTILDGFQKTKARS